MQSSERNHRIDLLRIVSMCMILMLHANGHGGGIGKYEFGTMGYTLLWLVESACIVGVNEFVLITGYYGTVTKFKVSKLLAFYL